MATIDWQGEGAPEEYRVGSDGDRERVRRLTRRIAGSAGNPMDGKVMPEWMTRMVLSEVYGCPERVLDDVVAWRMARLHD